MQDYRNSLLLHFDDDYRFAAEEEPSRFLFETGGKLVITDDDNEIELGAFSAMVVDVQSAIVEHESVFDVFDSHSTSITYFQELYDHGSGDFKPRVLKVAYGDNYYLWNPNLLILDRLIVYPEHRGHGVGLLALRALIQRLRVGVGLIAMKPFPLQYEAKFLDESDADERKRLGLEDFKLPQPKATAKLKKYYGRLGFKTVPRTEYMVRSVELPLPPEASL